MNVAESVLNNLLFHFSARSVSDTSRQVKWFVLVKVFCDARRLHVVVHQTLISYDNLSVTRFCRTSRKEKWSFEMINLFTTSCPCTSPKVETSTKRFNFSRRNADLRRRIANELIFVARLSATQCPSTSSKVKSSTKQFDLPRRNGDVCSGKSKH